MKKFLLILLLFAACKKDDPAPQMGCMTGNNLHGIRVYIRCCTNDQFLAGSAVKYGGIADFSDYTATAWEPTSDCSKCK